MADRIAKHNEHFYKPKCECTFLGECTFTHPV